MPFLFPEGTSGLFRVITKYRDPDNEKYFSDQYYYQLISGVAAASNIALAFSDNFNTLFQTIISSTCTELLLNVTNLGSTTDVYDTSFEILGEAVGDLLSPEKCLTFRMSTGNRLAPYGWKRTGYVTEAMSANKGAIDSAFVTEVINFADFLVSDLNDGSFVANAVLVSPANETHDDNLVLPFQSALFQKIGHADGRKSY